jgi:hypothetical protein
LINNRQQQAGRRRGRSGGGGNNGGGPRQGGQGRPDNGNRIDNRARGNANQLYEKYKNLAADSQRQGDRVNTEYYLQFADHYFRVLSDQRGRFDDQPQQRRPSQDFEGDDEYGDEGEPIRAGEQGDAPRQERGDRPDRQERADRPERAERQDRPREARRHEARDGEERPRRQHNRDDRPARPVDRSEAEGQRNDEPSPIYQPAMAAQPQFQPQPEVAAQHRAEPIAAGENLEQRAEAILDADAPLAPRRRGRPRREAAPVVEAAGDSNGVDADRLPPSLKLSASDAPTEGEAPKSRRRRVRAAVTDDVAAS